MIIGNSSSGGGNSQVDTQGAYIVATVADLANVPLTVQRVYLSDPVRYGTLNRNTSATVIDGGVILGTVGNIWERELDMPTTVSPRYWGAIGDGKTSDGSYTTDNTAAFAAMVTYARTVTASAPDIVSFIFKIPNGIYAMSYLDLGDLSSFKWEGSPHSILIPTSTWTGLLNKNGDKCFVRINDFYGTDSTPNYNSYTSSTYFELNNFYVQEVITGAVTTTVGVYMGKCTHFTVNNMTLNGFGQTLKMSHSWNGVFSNGTITYCYMYGLVLDQGQFNGISFNDIDFSNGRSNYTLNLQNAICKYNSSIGRVHFNNCYFEGSNTIGFEVGTSSDLSLHGSDIEWKSYAAIPITSTLNSTTCTTISTSKMRIGDKVVNNPTTNTLLGNFPLNTTVTSIVDGTTFTMSANATATGTAVMTYIQPLYGKTFISIVDSTSCVINLNDVSGTDFTLVDNAIGATGLYHLNNINHKITGGAIAGNLYGGSMNNAHFSSSGTNPMYLLTIASRYSDIIDMQISRTSKMISADVMVDRPNGIDCYAGTTFVGSISGTVLTVASITGASGNIYIGQYLTGTGIPVGTTITSLGTGLGGTGTYNISTSLTVSSETIYAGAINPPSGIVVGSISGTVLTVTSVTAGSIAVGKVITGTATTAGTGVTIASFGTGSGGTGTYNLSGTPTDGASQTYYASASSPYGTATLTVPPAFWAKKFDIEISIKSGVDTYDWKSIDYKARFRYNGTTDLVNVPLTRVVQSVATNDPAQVDMFLVGYNTTTGVLTYKLTKLGAGYVKPDVTVKTIFSTTAMA
jgi:hypothetical protein